MAKVVGGIHGRPSGNVSGLVYGSARTRTGKVVTVRELVNPSNPQTAGQVIQRNNFAAALFSVRHLGSSLWQEDFNRAIGQLPGFQSMMSIILGNTDVSGDFNTPPDTPLGNLHNPAAGFTIVDGTGSGELDVSWAADLGLNGTTADILKGFQVGKVAGAGNVRNANKFSGAPIRSATSHTFTANVGSGVIQVGLYFEGVGTAAGLLSPVEYFELTLV